MIDQLTIDLFGNEKDQAAYDQVRAEFISKKVEDGSTRKDAQAEWDKQFPDGFHDWMAKGNRRYLTCVGEQLLINKINELVQAMNKVYPGETLKEVLKDSLE